MYVFFSLAGLLFGMATESFLGGRGSTSVTWAFLLIGLAMIPVNVLEYIKAGRQPNPEFPVPASERYFRPVINTLSFVVGAAIPLIF
jgi:hypothetical protein